MKPTILAVIPARGGSKGIVCKPLALLAGVPLIAYTLRSALAARSLDRIVVSTDSFQIARVAGEEGVDILRRPAELATDEAKTMDVIRHAHEMMPVDGKPADVIVTLQPTSPLRDSADINACVDLFRKTDADSVVTMTEAIPPPEWMYRIDESGQLHRLLDNEIPYRRQEADPTYVLNGAVYVTNRSLLESGEMFGGNMKAYIMDRAHSVDIDDPIDLTVAEAIMLQREGRYGRTSGLPNSR